MLGNVISTHRWDPPKLQCSGSAQISSVWLVPYCIVVG